MKTLTQIADALEAKRAELKSALESVKGEDGQVDVEAAQSRMPEFDALKGAIAGLETELKTARELEALARDNETEIKSMNQVQRTVAIPAVSQEAKSLAARIVESPEFKRVARGESTAVKFEIEGVSLKTDFTSSAGMAPQITRTGDIVPTAVYPLTIIDALPQIPTDQPTVRIQKETLVATATEVGETGTYTEAQISFADADFAAKKVGTILPVSDEEFRDIPGIQALIESRLIFDVNNRLNGQILSGSGTGDLVKGVLAYSIGTASCGTGALQLGSGSSAIYKAKQKLSVDGACEPNLLIMNPNDWAAVVTETASSSGVYLNTAAISTEPVNRIWGMTVVLSNKVTAGTLVLLDTNYVQVRPYGNTEVEIALNGTDFSTGKKSIRITRRVALVVRRDAAIMKVTSFTA